MVTRKTPTLLVLLLSVCFRTASAAQPPSAPPATGPTTAPAGPPAAPTTGPTTLPSTRPSADVQALIDRLAADDWRDRQKAEDKLVEIGDDAVPALRSASEASEAERRNRAASALARIEQIASNGPTLITLHLNDVSPKAVVAELVKQSGAPIKVWPDGLWDQNGGGFAGMFARKPKVSIDVDKQPFWLALADFCDKATVRPQEMGFNQGITLMQGGPSGLSGPRCLSGQFMIVATGAQRQRWVQFGPPVARQSSDSLSLQVYADPRARVIAYTSDPDVTEAVDDKGTSLGTHKAANGMPSMNQRPFTFSLILPLKYPDDGYTKLSKLKGSFSVVLATKSETLQIPDLEKAVNTSKTAAGRTLEVKQVKVTEHGINYQLTVRRAGLPIDQWRNIFNELQGVKITDAAGNLFTGSGGGSVNDKECEVQNSCNTSATVKGPLKLVWEMTTETKQESIPFEFRDLPLPTP